MRLQPFQSYSEAFSYITQFTNYERMTDIPYRRDVLDLDRLRRVLHGLGDPHVKFPIVHVAGTKGKGSVCAMTASILKSAGYRVGLFSKPHLIRLNERISVNGHDISDGHFVEMMNLLHPHLEKQRAQGNPLTFFDLITVLTLTYFAKMGVDHVALEVGLGGRLDSTNVVQPSVSVITGIDYDHTHILGNTLEKIAAEKAGIIKPGIPVISGVTDAASALVIQTIAHEKGAPLYVLNRDFHLRETDKSASFTVATWRRSYRKLRLHVLGSHQRRNTAVAIAAVEAFGDSLGLKCTEEQVRQGLAKVRIPGRIEVISRRPTIILDVAHNPVSLRALRETLALHYPDKHVVLLLGMSRDKDVRAGLQEILSVASSAVFTGIGHPRGIHPEELCCVAQETVADFECQPEPDIERALERALQLTGANDLLCITGSFYLAGAVAALWQKRHDNHH